MVVDGCLSHGATVNGAAHAVDVAIEVWCGEGGVERRVIVVGGGWGGGTRLERRVVRGELVVV